VQQAHHVAAEHLDDSSDTNFIVVGEFKLHAVTGP
jgi:hypothetical protein